MTNFKLQKGGTTLGGHSDHDVLVALAQDNARRVSGAVTPLTNNSGGTAGTSIAKHAVLVNVAASGSSLAGKSSTETALATVVDGLAEIIAKANTTATALGIATITNNSGATSADGTLGAVTVSVTGASTGVVAAATNATLDAIDNMQYQALKLVNDLAAATGVAKITADYDKAVNATVASLTVSGGTAADPGVTKVAMDAALAVYRNNIKTLATTLISVNTVAVPKVLAV